MKRFGLLTLAIGIWSSGLVANDSYAAVGFCPTNGGALTTQIGTVPVRWSFTPNLDGFPEVSGTEDLGAVQFDEQLLIGAFEADPVAFFAPDTVIDETAVRIRVYPASLPAPAFVTIPLVFTGLSGTVCQQPGASKWVLNSAFILNSPLSVGPHNVDVEFFARGNGFGTVTAFESTFTFEQLEEPPPIVPSVTPQASVVLICFMAWAASRMLHRRSA